MRNAVHGVIAALLWAVFFRYWQIVAQQPMNPDTRVAMATLSVLAFLGALYLILWVLYNVRLSRKFRRRQRRLLEPKLPVRDYLGRWIVVDRPEILRQAQYIEIDVKRIMTENEIIEEKLFRTSEPGGEEIV